MFREKEDWEKRLTLLFSSASSAESLDDTAKLLGEFLSDQKMIESLIIVHLEEREKVVFKENGIWDFKEIGKGKHILSDYEQKLEEHLQRLDLGIQVWNEENREIHQFPIRFQQNLCGILLISVKQGTWKEELNPVLNLICCMSGIYFVSLESASNEELSSFVFNRVLDSMKASIYISEPGTDKILFMNQTMKKEFGLEHPEGQICWKVLQNGMQSRCPFCPVEDLKKQKEGAVIQWEETSTVTGRSYNNYDSLITWMDGSTVHLQQSVDVTELKSANTDELTKLLTRRPGKDALRETLKRASELGNTVTVCMYDINRLKEVNDLYGHSEGDRLLYIVSDAIRDILLEGEYAFRLSGDEFIVLFQDRQKNVKQRIENVRVGLHDSSKEYEISFCYGLVEIAPLQPITGEEVLFLADERMYEQKRRFHIIINEKRQHGRRHFVDDGDFQYNKEYLYDALVQSTEDYLYISNMKTGVFQYPQSMVDEFGLPGQVIENAAAVWGTKVHEDDRASFLEANQEIADGRAASHCVEYRAKNRNGEWVWLRCRGHLEFDVNGEPELFAGFITNLGKKNKIDHLTGLYNKVEFEEAVHYLIESEPERGFGMMILGIDDLKHINDLYDRTFGDEVIRIISQRVQSILPGTASLYRLDGDEFGVLVRETDAESNVYEMERIFRAVRNIFENQQEYNSKKYYSSLSAGCLVYPKDAYNFLDLMKYAGYSLDYSKSHGKKRCTFFSQELLEHRSRTLEMVEELRNSIENDFSGFSLYFQPLVKASDGSLMGIEALSRWECERFGKVSPFEFVPILEQTGLIVSFGKWVLRTAVHICKDWVKKIPELILDVNISYLQIRETDFVCFVQEVLEREKFTSKNLIIELTESYFANENQRLQKVFREMRKIGVRIAMDDFGTGYSTLGILKEVPADIVKIDKTFVKDILSSNFDATFIRFIVALCHDVGILVCLEGVETQEAYEMVSQMGLDMIQGFLFSRPLPEKEFVSRYIASI